MTLDVFVPAPDSLFAKFVLPGSAIVGTEAEPGRWTVDYEGNRYEIPYLAEYATRLLHAAGRHEDRYPTVARMLVDETELVRVGSYETEDMLFDLENEEAFRAWVGE